MTNSVEVVNKEIAERVTVSRIALLMRYPFWGNLVSRLKVLQETSAWCSTACTDGRNIYYNPNFISTLTDKQLIFVFCHEVMHVVFEHLGRAHNLNHKKLLSNIAADFSVNQVIVSEKIGDHIGDYISMQDLLNFDKVKKTGTLYDPIFSGMSYEEIYEKLKEHEKELEDNLGSTTFSIHLDFSEDSSEDDESSGSKKPKLTQEELQEIKDNMREAVLNAAQSSPQNVPIAIKRIIKTLVEPKMDWRELLTQKVESQVKSDYTYMRLGRRSFSSDIIFPSQLKQPKIKVDLALDMSGSIGDTEIKIFFSEVQGIISQYSSFEIGILCWDTKVYNYQKYTEENINDIMEYEPQGGGGTDLSCVFDFYKENEIVPSQLVVFTDGEIYNWGDDEYCETLFIIKNKREITPPFGESVNYD